MVLRRSVQKTLGNGKHFKIKIVTLFQSSLLNDSFISFYMTKRKMYIHIWLTDSGDRSYQMEEHFNSSAMQM